MTQLNENSLSAKEYEKRFDNRMEILMRKMHENGSLVVEDDLGQLTIDLGIISPNENEIVQSQKKLDSKNIIQI